MLNCGLGDVRGRLAVVRAKHKDFLTDTDLPTEHSCNSDESVLRCRFIWVARCDVVKSGTEGLHFCDKDDKRLFEGTISDRLSN